MKKDIELVLEKLNEEALELLKQEAGQKWDPVIVDALLQINK